MAQTRQSISLTPPNDDWLRSQVESQEYASKSEVVNDLIRKQRETEFIRAQLIAGEQSDFTEKSRQEMLANFKQRARREGKL